MLFDQIRLAVHQAIVKSLVPRAHSDNRASLSEFIPSDYDPWTFIDCVEFLKTLSSAETDTDANRDTNKQDIDGYNSITLQPKHHTTAIEQVSSVAIDENQPIADTTDEILKRNCSQTQWKSTSLVRTGSWEPSVRCSELKKDDDGMHSPLHRRSYSLNAISHPHPKAAVRLLEKQKRRPNASRTKYHTIQCYTKVVDAGVEDLFREIVIDKKE